MQRQSALFVERLLSSRLLQTAASGNKGLFGSARTPVCDNSAGSHAASSHGGVIRSMSSQINEIKKQAVPAQTFTWGSTWERMKLFFAKRPVINEAREKESSNIIGKVAAATAALALLAAGPALADAPEQWQWGFQDSATSNMQALVDLHHDIMFFLITIATVVMWFLVSIVRHFHYSRQQYPEKLLHNTTIEVIWTIVPIIIIIAIAIPSLTLIYSMDNTTDRPGLTVKVIGRQWYWSYEMHDHLQHKLLDPDKLVAIAEKALTQ